jgi:hypothetical protein
MAAPGPGGDPLAMWRQVQDLSEQLQHLKDLLKAQDGAPQPGLEGEQQQWRYPQGEDLESAALMHRGPARHVASSPAPPADPGMRMGEGEGAGSSLELSQLALSGSAWNGALPSPGVAVTGRFRPLYPPPTLTAPASSASRHPGQGGSGLKANGFSGIQSSDTYASPRTPYADVGEGTSPPPLARTLSPAPPAPAHMHLHPCASLLAQLPDIRYPEESISNVFPTGGAGHDPHDPPIPASEVTMRPPDAVAGSSPGEAEADLAGFLEQLDLALQQPEQADQAAARTAEDEDEDVSQDFLARVQYVLSTGAETMPALPITGVPEYSAPPADSLAGSESRPPFQPPSQEDEDAPKGPPVPVHPGRKALPRRLLAAQGSIYIPKIEYESLCLEDGATSEVWGEVR